MTDKAFERVKKFVSKDAFTWIIKDSLSTNEISSILSRCGINYRGRRIQTLPTEVLAKDIAGEVYKNPKAQQLVKLYLDQANKNEIDEISQKSRSELLLEITTKKGEMLETGKVGKYLWAIITDERHEMTMLIPIFIGKVISTVKHFTQILKDLERSSRLKSDKTSQFKPIPRPTDIVRERLEKKIKEKDSKLEELQSSIDKLHSKIKIIEQKNDNLSKQYKELLTENQKIKHDFNILEKDRDHYEKTLQRLEKDKENIKEMISTIHRLERENKKLNYDLEKNKDSIEESRLIHKEKTHLDEIVSKLNERISILQNQLKNRDLSIEKLKKEKEKDMLKQKKETKKPTKPRTPSIGVFVDVQNIYYAAREKYDSKLDYHKLISEVLRGRKLYKAIAYVVKTPEINQENFIDALINIGYEVKSRDLKIRHDGSMKGDWDLGIAIDMIALADKLDAVILVSGDGDFVDLVKMLKKRNILVEVISFPHNTSQDLVDSADYWHAIDDRLLIKK